MHKKDVYINLINVDLNLESEIQNTIDAIDLETMNLRVDSSYTNPKKSVIEIEISKKNNLPSAIMKTFMHEYKYLNGSLQKLTLDYMQQTGSTIEFKYG